MGVQNKQRRAAKASRRRARRRERSSRGGPGRGGDPFRGSGTGAGTGFGSGAGFDPGSFAADPVEVADLAVTVTVQRLLGGSLSAEVLLAAARGLRVRMSLLPDGVLAAALRRLFDRLLPSVVEYWTPEDLAELVRRKAHERSLPTLAGLLRRVGGTAGSDAQWSAAVGALGPSRQLDVHTDDGLAEALHLAALLALAPAGEPGDRKPGRPAPPTPSPVDAKRLATVRGLLAKAESTPYDEEAEALTAKAQELVTRYALARLLSADAGHPGGSGPGEAVVARRIWLDPPYSDAKSSLVHEVAGANRCRAVYAQALGVSTVVGDPADVAAVELLVTSLLVQASRAMLRHGSQVDRAGMSRTRSFRRSFLTSFALRIGQRLREATQHEVDTAGRSADLLPALRTHSERVDDLLAEMFPHLVQREATISNPAGWAAGQVAADLAALDTHTRLEAAG